MERILIQFDEKASEIKELVDQLKSYIDDSPVSKKVRDGFSAIYNNINFYNKAIENQNLEKIAVHAKHLAVYGQLIGRELSKPEEANEQIKSIASELLKKSIEYRRIVEESPLERKPLGIKRETETQNEINSYGAVKANLKRLSDAHLEHDQKIKKLLNENDIRISDLSERVNTIKDDSERELKKVAEMYEGAVTELESKKEQINDILGHVSGRAIAGDFETSAEEEKFMANFLRFASLGCMTLIVGVVGYSFWETTTDNFQWDSSAFRVVLAIMLSIPAAYLARESAKHREQQYSHLQTSLDLKAITPYIASLPENEQHRIKVEVARKLFASRDFSKTGTGDYPENIHEIIMEILKKLETPKKS